MNQNRSRKKGSPATAFIIIGVAALVSAMSSMSEDAIWGIVGISSLIIPAVIVAAVVRSAARKKANVHTHDRIDHRTDLKINPQTGRAENAPVRQAQPHSAKEHWQQQLDALLANGTIDRSEYRAMMNRKF